MKILQRLSDLATAAMALFGRTRAVRRRAGGSWYKVRYNMEYPAVVWQRDLPSTDGWEDLLEEEHWGPRYEINISLDNMPKQPIKMPQPRSSAITPDIAGQVIRLDVTAAIPEIQMRQAEELESLTRTKERVPE